MIASAVVVVKSKIKQVEAACCPFWYSRGWSRSSKRGKLGGFEAVLLYFCCCCVYDVRPLVLASWSLEQGATSYGFGGATVRVSRGLRARRSRGGL